jgi:hypothetical protein
MFFISVAPLGSREISDDFFPGVPKLACPGSNTGAARAHATGSGNFRLLINFEQLVNYFR